MKKIVNRDNLVKRPSRNALRVAVLCACGVLTVGGLLNFAKARKNEMNVYSDVKNSDAYVEFLKYEKEKQQAERNNDAVDTFESMNKTQYDLNVGMSKEHFEKYATDEQKAEVKDTHIEEGISAAAGLVGTGVLTGAVLKKIKGMSTEDEEKEDEGKDM